MQTFLPYRSFANSAKSLDNKRLGKQRVETKQIYLSLTEPSYGWKNHPAVKMWKSYEPTLAAYGAATCNEWIRRGFNDSLLGWFEARSNGVTEAPNHFTESFFASHRSNLLRKNPEFYSVLFPETRADLPYLWPVASTIK